MPPSTPKPLTLSQLLDRSRAALRLAIRNATIADSLYAAALIAHYGRKAGDIRYRPDQQNAECRKLSELLQSASDAEHCAWVRIRALKQEALS